MTSDSSQLEPQRIFDIVATIWMQLLSIREIDKGDNFFSLGGDSLKASAMMAQILEQLSVGLDPIEIYDAPLLGDFVDLVASMSAELQAGEIAS